MLDCLLTESYITRFYARLKPSSTSLNDLSLVETFPNIVFVKTALVEHDCAMSYLFHILSNLFAILLPINHDVV